MDVKDLKPGMNFTRTPVDPAVKPYIVQVRELNAKNALVAHYGGSEWIPQTDLVSTTATPTGTYAEAADDEKLTKPQPGVIDPVKK